MNDSNEDPQVASIRARVQLNFEAVQRLATDAGIGEFAEEFFSALRDFDYVNGRVYEVVRSQPDQYKNREPAEEYAEFYTNGDDGGWDWKKLFPPKRGGHGHDILLELFDLLRVHWNTLPSGPGKRRPRWNPAFEVQGDETIPINATGVFFLGVARLFGSYSSVHCGSVFERARRRRQSPESKAKRAERNRKYAAEHRARKRADRN